MSYFLSENNLSLGQPAVLKGPEADHILLSRRVKIDEQLAVQGPDGKRFICDIQALGKHEVGLLPQQPLATPPEPLVQVLLLQAVVGQNTLDLIFQKAVELGAAKVILFNAAKTATRLSNEKFAAKLPRWQKILWEAAKQCGRARVPELVFLPGFKEMLAAASQLEKIFLMDSEGGHWPAGQEATTVGVIIGPEGGLAAEEIAAAKQLPNCLPISLGPRLLRAETAAIAALALLGSL